MTPPPMLAATAGGVKTSEPEIAQMLIRQRDAISQLETVVEHLEQRLDVMCAPAAPEPATPVAEAPSSQLGRVLGENSARVSTATNRVARLLSRLQL